MQRGSEEEGEGDSRIKPLESHPVSSDPLIMSLKITQGKFVMPHRPNDLCFKHVGSKIVYDRASAQRIH